MSIKAFWIVIICSEVIAGTIAVLSGFEVLPKDSCAIDAFTLLLGPILVALYHTAFVSPYLYRLLRRNIDQEIFISELVKMRDEHRQELRRSHALLTNLTTGTRNRTRKEMGVRFVYFIADRTAGRVKIGVSHDPEKRLAALQGANGGKLEIIATVSGDERHEQALHDTFKHLRLNGEWFRLTPEIEAFAIENAE